MSTTIGKLVVSLTANTGPLRRGLTGAAGMVKRFGSGIVKLGKMLVKFGTVATAAAVAGLTLIVKAQLAAIDSIAKTSAKLGIATEDLIAYQHGAKLAGLSTQTFDMALQRMIRRVAEAAEGTGEAKAALKELQLDPKLLKQAGPGGALMQIADALQGVKSQADRVRLAFKLFDSEGVALINVLQGGSEALRRMQAEAERLGLTFSRLDAAQVEEANDAITALKGAIKGLAQNVTIELAGAIKVTANAMTALVVQIKQGGSAVTIVADEIAISIITIGVAIDKVSDGIRKLSALTRLLKAGAPTALLMDIIRGRNSVEELKSSLEALTAPASDFATQWSKALAKFRDDIRKATAETADQPPPALGDDAAVATAMRMAEIRKTTIGSLEKELAGLVRFIDEMGKSRARLLQLQLRAAGATEDERKAAGELLEQIERLESFKKGLMKSQDEANALAADGQRIWDQTRTALERYEQEVEHLRKVFKLGFIDQETLLRSMTQAEKDLQAATVQRQRQTRQISGAFERGTAAAHAIIVTPPGVRTMEKQNAKNTAAIAVNTQRTAELMAEQQQEGLVVVTMP